jgi:hypothetical protein
VYVNLLRATAKQAPSKNEGQAQNHYHKDYQDCDNPGAAAAAISIVSHKRLLLFVGGIGETN